MFKKSVTLFLLVLLSICFNCQQKENPKNICKDCGSFDLSKMTFNENISDLISKTEVWKTAIVNRNNEEKEMNEILKSDTLKLYKYHFSNQLNKNLGKKPFNYNNQFYFDGLTILTDANNKIYAYNATDFYDGKISEIKDFINYLKKDNNATSFAQNQMIGDLSVYQWKSENKIVQLVSTNEEGSEEQTVNGITSTVKSTYVKLNVFNNQFMKNSVGDLVKNDIDFSIFNKKHFINEQ